MNRNKSSIPLIVLVIALLFTISCSKGGSGGGGGYGSNPPPAPAPAANTINITNMSFSPGDFTVKAGTTVTWVNNDGVPHTVTADDNTFDSGSIAGGEKYTHTFGTAGTITYHCNFHGGMTGKVTVN